MLYFIGTGDNVGERMQAKEYRADIDVLRAIAVLAVIFYHAHIPFFRGGFVGVSIFFVISGYLITGIIKRKLADGTFSFLEFYENRVRRIFPALAVLMVFWGLLYYFLSMPEILGLQRSVRRALFGLANFFFYANTDYFDPAAETMPLLHTWSLGVEEQFYFVFPLLLFILNIYIYIKKPSGIKIVHILFALFLLSFIFSAVFVFYNQKFTFYMLPARAWELLCGSILAYTAWTPATQKGKSFCILSGLGIMFASIVLSGDVLFPGFWALPPCLGAVLYIAGGTSYAFSNRANIIHAVTNNKALVFIGVISYSLYLWHWPVLVFYSTFPFYKEITLPAAGILIVLTIFISYLSWRFVERPVRQLPLFKNRKILWIVTLVCAAGIFTMATYMRYGKSYDIFNCSRSQSFTAFPKQAAVKGKIPVDFILIGDSHRFSEESLFQKMAEQYRLTGITSNQRLMKNTFISKYNYKRGKIVRMEWNRLTELFERYSCENLFIVFRYSQKIDGKERYYSQDEAFPIYYIPDKKLTPQEAFLQSMRDMLDEAVSYGIKHIYIQYPVPEPKDMVPNKATMLTLFFEYPVSQINEKLGEKLTEYRQRNKDVFEAFAILREEYPQIEFVDISPYYLNADTRQFAVMDEKNLFYYDDDHLSHEGAMLHMEAYEPVFARIAKQKAENEKQGG